MNEFDEDESRAIKSVFSAITPLGNSSRAKVLKQAARDLGLLDVLSPEVKSSSRWKRILRRVVFISALTLVCLHIVLAPIVIGNFIRAREASYRSQCIANMKQIEGAIATWALENKKTLTDAPLAKDLYGEKNYILNEPVCPGGGVYYLGTVGGHVRCSLASKGHTLK